MVVGVYEEGESGWMMDRDSNMDPGVAVGDCQGRLRVSRIRVVGATTGLYTYLARRRVCNKGRTLIRGRQNLIVKMSTGGSNP